MRKKSNIKNIKTAYTHQRYKSFPQNSFIQKSQGNINENSVKRLSGNTSNMFGNKSD